MVVDNGNEDIKEKGGEDWKKPTDYDTEERCLFAEGLGSPTLRLIEAEERARGETKAARTRAPLTTNELSASGFRMMRNIFSRGWAAFPSLHPQQKHNLLAIPNSTAPYDKYQNNFF